MDLRILINTPVAVREITSVARTWRWFQHGFAWMIRFVNAKILGTDDLDPLDPVQALQKITECLKDEEDWVARFQDESMMILYNS